MVGQEKADGLDAGMPPVRIRQDLSIHPAEPDADGSPAWVLYDPLANRYFRLGQLEADLLSYVGQGSPMEIAARASAGLGEPVDAEQVEALEGMLRQNNLVQADGPQIAWFLKQRELAKKGAWFSRLAKSYLFFRIPMVRPDRFLEATLPYVGWLGSALMRKLLILALVVGLFLTVRQFDVFLSTFLHFFNLSGLLGYLFVLLFIKVLHELGHAYTAKSMGCHVPVIGVAFLVGWPVLYTDTSDAWRIPSRCKRMQIAAAGVSVELAVAALSLLLWNLAPEGLLKSSLFLLATTTWMLSILVNFNPLMRFDGYYLLSDVLHTPNLENRSFNLAKWWLREQLFGLGREPPEFPRKVLILFAFSVWIYRFFLFIGIALLVYYFFFKLAGIILFLVEIVYFIVLPIGREVMAWWGLRDEIHWNHATRRSVAILTCLLPLFFLPWRGNLLVPAIHQNHVTRFYAPVSGQVKSVNLSEAMRVNGNELLFEMAAPELVHELDQVGRRYQELRWQRAALGFDRKMRSRALVVASELQTQNQRLRGLVKKRDRLQVHAKSPGQVIDITPDIKQGDWLTEGALLFTIVDREQHEITAYVPEEDLGRLQVGVTGRFYPEAGQWPGMDVRLVEIESVGMEHLDLPYQASLFGGDVAVREQQKGEYVPVSGSYRLRFEVVGEANPIRRVIRGVVRLEADTQSLFSRLWRWVIMVFQRESGF